MTENENTYLHIAVVYAERDHEYDHDYKVTIDADVEWVPVTKEQFRSVQKHLPKLNNNFDGFHPVLLVKENSIHCPDIRTTTDVINECVEFEANEKRIREKARIDREMKKHTKEAALVAKKVAEAKLILETYNEDGTPKHETS